MIDRRAAVILGVFGSGRASALIPDTAWGFIFSMCAAFLTGYAARRLLDAADRKDSADV